MKFAIVLFVIAFAALFGGIVSAAIGEAYVVNFGSNNDVLINAGTNMTVGTLTTGFDQPWQINFVNTYPYGYATNFGSSNIVIINPFTNLIVGSVKTKAGLNLVLNQPTGIAFAPSGKYAYVSNYGLSTVLIINTATNTIIGKVKGTFNGPEDLHFAPSGTFAYVANSKSNNVLIVNTATNSVTGTINGFSNDTGVSFAPSGLLVYVTNYNNNTVSIVNPVTNTTVGSISGFNGPTGIEFSPDGSFAYVTNKGNNTVAVVSSATNSIMRVISGGFKTDTGVDFNPYSDDLVASSITPSAVHDSFVPTKFSVNLSDNDELRSVTWFVNGVKEFTQNVSISKFIQSGRFNFTFAYNATGNMTLSAQVLDAWDLVVTLSQNVQYTQPKANRTTVFQNGNIVNYTYTDVTCTPSVYNTSEAVAASNVTDCEVGGPFGVNINGATPLWVLIPNFAGLSTYGFPGYPSSPNGYPLYNGSVIKTQCNIGNMSSTCPGKPTYFYSPLYSKIETDLGINKGIGKLPQGVLTNAARDFIVPPSKNGTYSRSYVVRVSVFDPNIFPNATTGKCKQVAPSSLPNPTANCLTSPSALAAAINTTDTAVSTVNANNQYWKDAGMPTTQASILLITQNTRNLKPPFTNATYTLTNSGNVNTPNADQTSWSFVNATSQSPPVTTVSTTVSTVTTTIAASPTTQAYNTPQPSSPSGGSNTALYEIAAIVIVIVLALAWLMMRGKKPAQPPAQSAQ